MFEPVTTIDLLNQPRRRYVVVGRWGTLHHGATCLIQDLDICPRTPGENLERLAEALTGLHIDLQITRARPSRYR